MNPCAHCAGRACNWTFLCLILKVKRLFSDPIHQVGSSFDQTRSCRHKEEHRLCNRVPAGTNVPKVLPWTNTREICPVCTKDRFSGEERQHGPSPGILYVLQIGTRGCIRECWQAVDFVIWLHTEFLVLILQTWPSCTALGYSGYTSVHNIVHLNPQNNITYFVASFPDHWPLEWVPGMTRCQTTQGHAHHLQCVDYLNGVGLGNDIRDKMACS